MSEQDGSQNNSDLDETHSRSTTPNSTSTYEHALVGHEPYQTFQSKVLSVAREISECDEVVLERLRGGSYNRVVIARLTQGDQHVRGIFRIPRYTDVTGPPDNEHDEGGDTVRQVETEVRDQAAVLQLLASQGLSVPALLAFDARADNTMSRPCVLQRCSSGTALDKVYSSMSHKEKLNIADELVRVLISAEKVISQQSGPVIADQGHTPRAASYLFDQQGPALQVGVKRFSDTPATSLSDLLLNMLRDHLANDMIKDIWSRLCDIHDEMKEFGVFDSEAETHGSSMQSIIYHWDLESRNILIKRAADGAAWVIDMVVDWDRVLAVPPVLTRRPPVWLWHSSEAECPSISSDYDGGDDDFLDPTRYDAGGGRLSAENRRLKEHFEKMITRALGDVYP